jgi:hypothetical protein
MGGSQVVGDQVLDDTDEVFAGVAASVESGEVLVGYPSAQPLVTGGLSIEAAGGASAARQGDDLLACRQGEVDLGLCSRRTADDDDVVRSLDDVPVTEQPQR